MRMLDALRSDELWSLAVSAINGCGMCMESHDNIVRAAALTQVQAAVWIATLVHTVASVLDGEDALATSLDHAA